LEPIIPMVGEPPYTELLQPGVELSVGEWTLSATDDWTLTAHTNTPPPTT
jgi:hypothetical protein